MKKNKDSKKSTPQESLRPASSFSLISWTKEQTGWVVGGIITVIIGFAVLSKSDPAGLNWASSLCPFLILGGYFLIGVGLWKIR